MLVSARRPSRAAGDSPCPLLNEVLRRSIMDVETVLPSRHGSRMEGRGAGWRSWRRVEWPRRQREIGRWTGIIKPRSAMPAGLVGTSDSDDVRNFSHPTDACRSVGAERNRGYQSGHPVRTLFRPRGRRRHCSRACPCRGRRFPLASGTSATPCGRLPFWSAGVLWIEANRWVTCGLRRSPALLRPSPVLVSRGCWRFDTGRWITRGVL